TLGEGWRGEKGCEAMPLQGVQNVWACIDHCKGDMDLDGIKLRGDGEPARFGGLTQRLMGMRDEVNDYLMELIGISPERWNRVWQIHLHLHIVYSELVGQQFHALPDDLVQEDLLPFGWTLLGQRQEVFYDACAALCRLADVFRLHSQRASCGQLAEEHCLAQHD